MDTNRIQEIKDLRADGLDCFQIARKLELTVPEVEEIVYGTSENDEALLLFWAGQHH